MVSVKHFRFLLIALISTLLAACLSGPQQREEPQPTGEDIYSAIKNDEIVYREDQAPIEKGSPEYIENGIRDLRIMYHDGEYLAAKELSNKLLKLKPDLTEVYYWLARIYVDEADFQTAYNMATKGLNYAEEEGMIRELEWLQRQTQMGAN